jgi:hypothetical protein
VKGVAGTVWAPDDQKELDALLTARKTDTYIAEHFGISRDTLRRAFRKMGLTRPAGVQWPGMGKGSPVRSSPEADTLGLSRFKDQLLKDIAKDSVVVKKPHPTPKRLEDPHALEVCLFDLHIGKYGWGEETGEDYDTDIAEARARDAAVDLLGQGAGACLEEIIVPIGNDLLHYDNLEGTTTAGTILDRDTRFQRMYRRARGLMSWLIQTCAEHANVRAVIVPGNHDSLSAFTLGEVLAAEYAKDARVTFDNSPRKRKYVPYGKNLVVYAHGHAEPHRKLPGIIAAEEPQLWAGATTREVHLGHFHKSKVTEPIYVDDHEGCTVRVLRSLSGTDAWHSSMGYVGNTRGAEAFLWRKSGGLRANFYHQVL